MWGLSQVVDHLIKVEEINQEDHLRMEIVVYKRNSLSLAPSFLTQIAKSTSVLWVKRDAIIQKLCSGRKHTGKGTLKTSDCK